MIRKLASMLCCIVVAVCATPSLAQDRDMDLGPHLEVGSHIPTPAETLEEKQVRQMQKRVGDCIFARDEDLAIAYLRASDFVQVDWTALGHDFQYVSDELDFGRCLGRAMRGGQFRVQMRYDTSVLRFMLSEEAYLDRHDAAPDHPGDRELVTDARYFTSLVGSGTARIVARFGDCVVARAPGEADRLLRTVPSTDREWDAILAMESALIDCQRIGQEIEMTPRTIRAVVSDALWALSEFILSGDDSREEA